MCNRLDLLNLFIVINNHSTCCNYLMFICPCKCSSSLRFQHILKLNTCNIIINCLHCYKTWLATCIRNTNHGCCSTTIQSAVVEILPLLLFVNLDHSLYCVTSSLIRASRECITAIALADAQRLGCCMLPHAIHCYWLH